MTNHKRLLCNFNKPDFFFCSLVKNTIQNKISIPSYYVDGIHLENTL